MTLPSQDSPASMTLGGGKYMPDPPQIPCTQRNIVIIKAGVMPPLSPSGLWRKATLTTHFIQSIIQWACSEIAEWIESFVWNMSKNATSVVVIGLNCEAGSTVLSRRKHCWAHPEAQMQVHLCTSVYKAAYAGSKFCLGGAKVLFWVPKAFYSSTHAKKKPI